MDGPTRCLCVSTVVGRPGTHVRALASLGTTRSRRTPHTLETHTSFSTETRGQPGRRRSDRGVVAGRNGGAHKGRRHREALRRLLAAGVGPAEQYELSKHLQSMRHAGASAQALALMLPSGRKGAYLNTSNLNTLLLMAADVGDEGAQRRVLSRFLDSGRERDVYTWAALMRMRILKGQAAALADLFDEFDSWAVGRSGHLLSGTLRGAMRCFGSAKMYARVFDCFSRLKNEEGAGAGEAQAADTVGDRDLLPADLMPQGPRNDTTHLSAASTSSSSVAISILIRSVADGLGVPDATAFAAALALRKHDGTWSDEARGTAIKHASNKGDMKELLRLSDVHDISIKDAVPFNVLLSSLLSSLPNGPNSGAGTHRVVSKQISGNATSRAMSVAFGIVQSMRRVEIEPSIVTWTSLLQVAARVRHSSAGYRIIDSVVKLASSGILAADSQFIHAILTYVFFSGSASLETLDYTLKNMSALGMEESPALLRRMLEMCARAGQGEVAEQIVHRLRVLDGTVTLGAGDYSLALFAVARECEISQQGPTTSHTARVMRLLSTMSDTGIVPDVDGFNAVIKVLCLTGSHEYLDGVEQTMTELGVYPNALTISTIVKTYSRMGEVQRAVDLAADMQRQGLTPSNEALQALFRSVQPGTTDPSTIDAAVLLYLSLVADEDGSASVSPRVHDAALSMMLHSGDRSHARTTLERVVDSGLYGSVVLESAGVNAPASTSAGVGHTERQAMVFGPKSAVSLVNSSGAGMSAAPLRINCADLRKLRLDVACLFAEAFVERTVASWVAEEPTQLVFVVEPRDGGMARSVQRALGLMSPPIGSWAVAGSSLLVVGADTLSDAAAATQEPSIDAVEPADEPERASVALAMRSELLAAAESR